MRRPLALICVVLCFILYYSRAGDRGNIELDSHSNDYICGYVEKKEIKNDKQIIYLKNVTFSSNAYPNEEKLNSEANFDIGAICYLDSGSMPKAGSFVMLSGEISEFRSATNKGEFDMKTYYESLGYHFQVYKCKVLAASKDYSVMKEYLYSFKKNMGDNLEKIYDVNDASILKAMILGDKSDMSSEIKDLYQKGGISHILAISGLHISIIGMLIFNGLKRLKCRLVIRTTVSSVVMLIYGIMTEMGASTKRAIIMFIFLMAAYTFKRSYDIVTALAIAAFFIVAPSPLIINNAGFWMSFAAVIGIAIFSKSILIGKDFENKKVREILNPLLSSVAVSYFTLPIVLLFYYEYPLYSVLLNLLVIPFVGILLSAGIISLIIGSILIRLGIYNAFLFKLIGMPCHYILKLYEVLCQIVSRFPKSSLILGKPTLVSVVIFYVASMIIYNVQMKMTKEKNQKNYRKWIITKTVIMLATLLLFVKNKSGLVITMIDVGQGDGILIECDNNTVMIDGGSSSNDKLYSYVVSRVFKYKGIDNIDYWFISHPDSDHCSALIDLLKEMQTGTSAIKVRNIMLSNVPNIKNDASELIYLARKNKVPVRFVSAGDELNIADVSFTLLHPKLNDNMEDPNEYSEVILLRYKDFAMLFTGDASMNSEESFISYAANHNINLSKINLLKVGHHGSKTSTSGELIRLIKPEYALISAGKRNSYGHPHKEIIDRLLESDVRIVRTDMSGMIEVVVRKGKYSVESFVK